MFSRFGLRCWIGVVFCLVACESGGGPSLFGGLDLKEIAEQNAAVFHDNNVSTKPVLGSPLGFSADPLVRRVVGAELVQADDDLSVGQAVIARNQEISIDWHAIIQVRNTSSTVQCYGSATLSYRTEFNTSHPGGAGRLLGSVRAIGDADVPEHRSDCLAPDGTGFLLGAGATIPFDLVQSVEVGLGDERPAPSTIHDVAGKAFVANLDTATTFFKDGPGKDLTAVSVWNGGDVPVTLGDVPVTVLILDAGDGMPAFAVHTSANTTSKGAVIEPGEQRTVFLGTDGYRGNGGAILSFVSFE